MVTFDLFHRYSSPSLPENITCNHNTKSFACKQLKILDLVNFHRSFYSKPNKQHQDALILKYCSVKKTARKRPVKNVRKSRAFSIKYAIYAKSLKKAIQRSIVFSSSCKTSLNLVGFLQRKEAVTVRNRSLQHKDNQFIVF